VSSLSILLIALISCVLLDVSAFSGLIEIVWNL